ncbi:lipase [Ophiostoma piceae UAMH 11346]|uniref:Lipase n=1 Tax=Ophiostoma piceae (strain UAMH 11346) TaxID=1262450 RepID=S3CM56_OPHP1|nr:lipase [Ophiostoma piceae UAMH 11346]
MVSKLYLLTLGAAALISASPVANEQAVDVSSVLAPVATEAVPPLPAHASSSKGFKLVAFPTDHSDPLAPTVKGMFLNSYHHGAGLNLAVLHGIDAHNPGAVFYLNKKPGHPANILTSSGAFPYSFNVPHPGGKGAQDVMFPVGDVGTPVAIKEGPPSKGIYVLNEMQTAGRGSFLACKRPVPYYHNTEMIVLQYTYGVTPQGCVPVRLVLECAHLPAPQPNGPASHDHVRPTLTAGEALHLYLVSVPAAIGTFFYTFTRHTLRRWRNGVNAPPNISAAARLKRDLFTSIGALMTVFSLRELQYIQRRTTGDAVRAFATSRKLKLESVLLSDLDTGGFAPATLHLLDLDGSKPLHSGKVMLYFHGGAYISALNNPRPAHVLASRMGAQQLAILEYGLAPACPYPTQLAQAVAALQYLVEKHGGYSYQSVVVAGESAGANLALALLAHMQTPHPRVKSLSLTPSSSLLGILAISARTRNDPTRLSHEENDGKDMLSKASMARISEAWKPVAGEVWAAPDLADRSFWHNFRAKHVLLTAGGDEIYRDDIIHTAEMMNADVSDEDEEGQESRVEVIVCPGEVHVQCVSDMALGIEGGIMTTAVLEWADSMRDV